MTISSCYTQVTASCWNNGIQVFCVPHPDFDRSLLKVTTEEDTPTEATHGSDWFWVEAYEGSTDFEYPEEWDA